MSLMKFFENGIKNFYTKYARLNLPWRKKIITPYEVWVSEVMLQQTQVPRVIEYYRKFLKKFPDIFSLSKSSWKEFLPYYRGLGYYRRGENMLKTAKTVVETYNGVFPMDKEALESLPGIGEYTASAILSFAYDKDVIAFDTNAQRVYGRFFYGDKKARVNLKKIEKGLGLNKKKLNAAVMDFASLICKKSPKCEICPLKKRCKYFSQKGKSEIIHSKSIDSFPVKEAQVFLWLHKNHKEYYSPSPDTFEVFRLPKEYNTRAEIKKYFKKRYGIEVSVRPPHKKIHIDGIPTIFVNDQILLGRHGFGVFKKEDLV